MPDLELPTHSIEGANQDVPTEAPNLLNSAGNSSCASTEILDEDQGTSSSVHIGDAGGTKDSVRSAPKEKQPQTPGPSGIPSGNKWAGRLRERKRYPCYTTNSSRNPPSKVGHLIIHQLGDGSTDSYNQRGGRPKTQCDKDLDSVPAQQSPQRKTDSDVGSGTYFPGEGQKIVAEDLQHKEVVGDLLQQGEM